MLYLLGICWYINNLLYIYDVISMCGLVFALRSILVFVRFLFWFRVVLLTFCIFTFVYNIVNGFLQRVDFCYLCGLEYLIIFVTEY